MTNPTVRELLTIGLSDLSRQYGIASATLWNRRAWIVDGRHGSHQETCASLCADSDCSITHDCWCPEGNLTFAQYMESRPGSARTNARP